MASIDSWSWQYPSPSYKALQTFTNTQDDFPGPRCGHTLTAVSYRLILFGGSTAVKSDGSGISLEGVTNSVHCFNLFTKKWTRVYPDGLPPSPRACHAAASSGPMVAILGGIGPSGPCTGDLHILDMTSNKFKWQKVNVQGVTPGPRYGHVMGLADRRIVIFGGNNGNEILADTWALDTTRKPNVWERLNPCGNLPSARMYASADSREDYYFVMYGGKDCFGMPLGDSYGLETIGNDCWKWAPVAGVAHSHRYQHTAVFVGARLHIIGGALSRAHLIEGETTVAVLNTCGGAWLDSNEALTSEGATNQQYINQFMRRCRHAAASVGNRIYIFGGLREGVLLDDFLVSDADIPRPSSSEPGNPSFMRRSASESSLDRLAEAHANLPTVEIAFYASVSEGHAPLQQGAAASSNEWVGNLRRLVRQASLDAFQRRQTSSVVYSSTPQFTRTQKSTQDLVEKVISTLLKPQSWEPPATRKFFLSYMEVVELCSAAEDIIKQEPTLLQLNAPIKVFGDLHGQFGDLMRLFYEYGSPSKEGDISYIDYLFLGDYVDRGKHSLETIILLLALKIEYPKNIHLIRGNHESRATNEHYGFKGECEERMGKRDGVEAWEKINHLFHFLPLAALIEKKILCMHGGIGSSEFKVEHIANIQRPVYPDSLNASRVVRDLLWSDPTENDSVLGVRRNARGACVVSFGPDVVKAFCERNNLEMIIRAHECVLDGFERFAQGQLITVFSATNYCGKVNNAGAILVIGRDLIVVPKLIHPLPPPISPSESYLDKAWMELDSERPPTPVRGRPKPDSEQGSTS